MARPLNDLGEEMLHDIPPRLRSAPEFQAIMHCASQEVARMDAALETLRAQFNPLTADVRLGAWESLVQTSVERAGATLEDRRHVVIALHRKSTRRSTGSDWVANVADLVGEGWSYEEHIPGDPTSPPPWTIRITLPFPPSSDRYPQTEKLVRDITPAAWDIVLGFSGGFILDESQMDQETMQ